MNYRHAFHAGNFAEVVKHAVLARVVVHLRAKPTPFRIIDTHAGPGISDLTGPEASRTGEWRRGIARLIAAPLAPAIRDLLAPYLDVVARLNPGGELTAYPGSPAIAQALLRSQDRLLACELAPPIVAQLARRMGRDPRVKVLAIDGWTALGAAVPPKERRGAVLVDPPFEKPGELGRLASALEQAHRKWATGIYLLWYPIKDLKESEIFVRRIASLGIAKTLRAELMIGEPTGERLAGSGLVVVNPPWTLKDELSRLLPALAAILAEDRLGASRLGWIVGEK